MGISRGLQTGLPKPTIHRGETQRGHVVTDGLQMKRPRVVKKKAVPMRVLDKRR
jgi:hypothetical protein